MADVLACVPTLGLDVVVSLAERCVETGYTSIEQVRHFLTHHQESNAPAPKAVIVPAALILKEPPLADTARYDQIGKIPSPAGLAEESENV